MKREKIEREADRYKQEMAFTQKLSNFWYYNKWKIFFSVAGVLLIASLLVVTLTKKKEDLHVLYVTENSIVYTEKIARLQALFEKYAEDIDGDGEVNVVVENLYIGSDAYHLNTAKQNKERIVNVLRAGDCMLVVADGVGMDYLYQGGSLEDLSGIVESEAFGGKAWEAGSNSNVRQELMLAEGENLYMGLRVFSGTIAASSKDKTTDFEHAKRIFQRIITE